MANNNTLLGSGVGQYLPSVTSFESVVITVPTSTYVDYQVVHRANYDYNLLSESAKQNITSAVVSHYATLLNISSTRVRVTLTSGSTIITVEILSLNSYVPTPICFPKGTPVVTNQGNVAIEMLNPDIHTIRNKRIVAITQTRPLFTHIVSIEKNALGQNLPSATTRISKEHKVFYKGKMVKAVELVKLCNGVRLIPYNGETLYNVLMEKHDNMMINNLICETLDPANIMAKICGGKYNSSEKNRICEELTEIIKKNNIKAYKKLYASLK